MKEAADSTLAEVRRKISETNSCTKLIGRLRKLRQLRKDQAERKGLSVRTRLVQKVHSLFTRRYVQHMLLPFNKVSCN